MKTLRARITEINLLRRLSDCVRNAEASAGFSAHSRAAQREFKDWERRVTAYLDDVETAITRNEGGELFPAAPLTMRADRLTNDLKVLCAVDAGHAAVLAQLRDKADDLQSLASTLHPRLQKELQSNVRIVRVKLNDARIACKTLQEVERHIAEAKLRLKAAADRRDFASRIDNEIAEFPAVLKRLRDRGTPVTLAWRQYAKELEGAVVRASEQHSAGLYDSASRFLSEVRDVDVKIEVESQTQRRRALSEISEWLARPELTPSVSGPFGDSMKELSGRIDQSGFLEEWRALQARISEDVRKRYIAAVQESQSDIKRIHKLRQKPLRTLQLATDPSSPRLVWEELLSYAKTMVRKC